MLKEIDIGHAGQSVGDAISELEVAVSMAKADPKTTAIKIIHGLGSGKVARGVRLWAKEQRGRFRAVINGEDYNTFNRDAVVMRSDFLSTNDTDFNRNNPGITIIWL